MSSTASKTNRRRYPSSRHLSGDADQLALRGRHTASAEGRKAWQEVINQLREVDQIFSTYRDDSIINRLDRGELLIEECPPEVAEVLNLGRQAERESEGAFSINLPLPDGRRVGGHTEVWYDEYSRKRTRWVPGRVRGDRLLLVGRR